MIVNYDCLRFNCKIDKIIIAISSYQHQYVVEVLWLSNLDCSSFFTRYQFHIILFLKC